MTALANKNCSICNASSSPVRADEAKLLLQELSGWEIFNNNNVEQLSKLYTFKSYPAALKFTQQVGELAELENHHPAILTEWGKVAVRWWTHTINGLHMNDFIMAARTDLINKKAESTGQVGE